ncbi:MinD/ParA family protein [Thermaerobacter sp. PB12/4term]|uniref:MinD/ParA family protein n=1 Tax=Thermaerobacter sp. PB12/4term TaxID=2293838 RepID=UPI000E328C48|nr:MinD/ParA family protein [Thermaerobacter sp. PB12/4term]QIA26951.1 MinD/ParA family protein [Thermaerobacter sp. PB12/4term]
MASAAPGLAEQARAVLVASGKGGVGKSNLSLNLAIAARRLERRVLLLDADVGLGNAEILAGVSAPLHLGDVLAGRCTLEQAVVGGPGGVDLLAGGHGLGELPPVDGLRWRHVLGQLAGRRWDLVVIDGGAGVGGPVRPQLLAARELLVVTTPEPTALADAYAVIKLVAAGGQGLPPRLWVAVNQVQRAAEGQAAFARLASVCRRFLGVEPHLLGLVPHDPRVREAVQRQVPLLLAAPHSPAARAVEAMARHLLGCPPPAAGGLLAYLARLWPGRGAPPGREAAGGPVPG